MPYDPDDLYTAEPKLLSIDFTCFPTFFSAPSSPPEYDLIMAEHTTNYHRVSESLRASMDSTAGTPDFDAGLLLLDPLHNTSDDDGEHPPKKERKITFHPTIFLKLWVSALFLSSFLVFILRGASDSTIPAMVFICMGLARNLFVILHHVCSSHLRVRFSIEFRTHSAKTGKKRGCPAWVKRGVVHVLFDFVLFVVILVTTIVAIVETRSHGWYRWDNSATDAACICAFIGNILYLFSLVDLGRPSNITTSLGVSFDYGGDKKKPAPGLQRDHLSEYRDIEAAGGLGVGDMTRKTGADSPVIV